MSIEFDYAKFAVSIRHRRGQLGLRDAAQEIGDISPSTLSRLERALTGMEMTSFVEVCAWMDADPGEFFKADGERPDLPNLLQIKRWLIEEVGTDAADTIMRLIQLFRKGQQNGG